MSEARHGLGWWLRSLVWLALLAGLTVVSLLGYWGDQHWKLDLFSHTRLQYLVAASGLAVCLVIVRRWFLMLLTVAVLLLNAWEVFSIPGRVPLHNPQQVYRAMSINVYSGNPQISRVVDYIRSEAPDFLALIEINGDWREPLEGLKDLLPHQEIKIWSSDFGYALLSKYPFTEKTFGYIATGTLAREVQTPQGKLLLLQVHPLAPTNERAWKWRNESLTKIADFCAMQEQPLLLLGDMNCSPWSPNFKNFLQTSGLHQPDVRWLPRRTWPAGHPWLWTPIDHILLSYPLAAIDEWVGPYVGSDHYPVVCDFVFASP